MEKQLFSRLKEAIMCHIPLWPHWAQADAIYHYSTSQLNIRYPILHVCAISHLSHPYPVFYWSVLSLKIFRIGCCCCFFHIMSTLTFKTIQEKIDQSVADCDGFMGLFIWRLKPTLRYLLPWPLRFWFLFVIKRICSNIYIWKANPLGIWSTQICC